jgi:hypothetical protein
MPGLATTNAPTDAGLKRAKATGFCNDNRGKFAAAQNADGTWTVKDLPIFGEVAKGEHGSPVNIDPKWLNTLVANHERLFKQNGYQPVLHFGHNDPILGLYKPPVIGKVRVKRAEPSDYNGAKKFTVFADVTFSAAEYKNFRDGKYPVFSAEIESWTNPLFGSVAALSKSPHFKFANAGVGKEYPYGVQAFAAKGTGGRFYFRHDGGSHAMAHIIKATRDGKPVFFQAENVWVADQAAAKKFDSAEAASPFHASAAKQFADASIAPADAAPAAPAAPAQPDIQQAMMQVLMAIADKLGCNPGKMQANGQQGDNAAPVEPEDKVMAGAAKYEAGLGDLRKMFASEFGKLSGELSTVTKRLADTDAAAAIRGRVEAALVRLKDNHYDVPAALGKRIEYFAAMGDEALNGFVENHMENAVPTPARDVTEFDNSGGADGAALEMAQSDPALAMFAANPKLARPAVVLGQQWEALAKRGRTSVSKLEFIVSNLTVAGHEIPDFASA